VSDEGANRRRFDRVPIEVGVDLWSENTFFTGFSENISEGGLFIATDAPFEIGSRLNIKLSLMGDEPVESEVVVRWVRPPGAAGGLPAGMGVQFETLEEQWESDLQKFIDSQAKDTLFFDLD
jgi:uncharacterized protein (TIGR02266 family)